MEPKRNPAPAPPNPQLAHIRILLRRNPSRKTTKQQENIQKENIQKEIHPERERAHGRSPTRSWLEQSIRPGADLSCLRQYTRTGPEKVGCMGKRRRIRLLAGALQMKVRKIRELVGIGRPNWALENIVYPVVSGGIW